MFRGVLRTSIAVLIIATATAGTILAQSLRAQAEKSRMLIGTAVNPLRFAEEQYAATLAREFNLIEPENGMKWGVIRPNHETFNFKPGDQVVEFARAHAMKVRGHCLLWHKYNPAWLANGQFTAEQLSALLKEHITTVMKHYEGQVFAWDVVNEAFDAKGGLEDSLWYNRPGIGAAGRKTAYIEQAFRWARAADPKALLFYNDYDTENLNPKSDAVYAMVKDFRKRGVPIDGVGIQAHLHDQQEIASLAANTRRLTALGVQVHITELDVGLPTVSGQLVDQADLTRQADIYRSVATSCLETRGCSAIQLWGFTDKYSWIPGFTRGAKGAALPFDRNYAPKPAYDALLKALEQRSRGATRRANQ